MKHAFYVSVLILAAVFISSRAYAAAQVVIVPSGNSSYTIQGSGMDGVAGIELTIRYDSVSLQGTPTVKQESLVSGAMFAANTTLPGSVKIAIISSQAFSGSGPIASISFLAKSPSAPLPVVTANMIDAKGAGVAATVGTVTTETVTATAGQTSSASGQTAQTSQTQLQGNQGGQSGSTSQSQTGTIGTTASATVRPFTAPT